MRLFGDTSLLMHLSAPKPLFLAFSKSNNRLFNSNKTIYHMTTSFSSHKIFTHLLNPNCVHEVNEICNFCSCDNCHTCLSKQKIDIGTTSAPFFMNMTFQRMILCPKCHNKRCPKATDHRLACSNSNEAGQPGSVY